MARTKKDQAEFERLYHDLAMARSMRWPEYPMPAPMTTSQILDNLEDGGIRWGSPQKVARGWFPIAGGYSGSARVTHGCSNGVSHSRDGNETTTQGMGRMYKTQADAWRALRHELTINFAHELAKIDNHIKECE